MSCGWKTQAAVSQYVLGKIPLNLEALIKFARELNVHPSEISPALTDILEEIPNLLGLSKNDAGAKRAEIPQLPRKAIRIAIHLSSLPDDKLKALSVVLGIKL